MPIYEFDCHTCGNSFDKLVRMSGLSEVTCPACASSEVKKKVSLFSSHGSARAATSAVSSAASCSPGGL